MTATRARLFAVCSLSLAALGCGVDATGPDGVEGVVAPLARGGGGAGHNFSCNGGVCECDKSIENDCEDMSGVCSEGSLDGLIACINGWLTTHCTCTMGLRTSVPGSIGSLPTGGVLTTQTAPVSGTSATPPTTRVTASFAR